MHQEDLLSKVVQERAMQAWQITSKHGQEKQGLPYSVTLGRRRGYPRCRGCHKLITDQKEPRVTIQGLFKPTSLKPFPVAYSVCANQDCLQKALQQHSQKVTSHPGTTIRNDCIIRQVSYFPSLMGRLSITCNPREPSKHIMESIQSVSGLCGRHVKTKAN